MSAGCAVLGHRFAFTSTDATMSWSCRRCGTGGSKTYASARAAHAYARAFDAGPDELGRHAPLGLLPLRLWRSWRQRAGATSASGVRHG